MVRLLSVALIVLGFVAGAPAPSEACINEVELTTNQRTQLLARAQQDLAAGRLARALERVGQLSDPRARAMDLFDDAGPSDTEVIRAVAVVRLDGRVDAVRSRAQPRVDDATRQANLAWALSVLRPYPDSPRDHARHAEALARIDGRAADAVRILQDLAARDLMPDAWAYRALAEARTRLGDSAGASAATEECRARSRRNTAICRLAATPRA